MVFFLEIYQLFFLFFKTLIKWRKLSLEFSLEVICGRWIFKGESKHFILNGPWWKLSRFIMVFFLELYLFFFLFFKLWSDREILAWNYLSKWSAEDGCSAVRVSTLLECVLMRTCLVFLFFKTFYQLFLVTPSVCWLMNES